MALNSPPRPSTPAPRTVSLTVVVVLLLVVAGVAVAGTAAILIFRGSPTSASGTVHLTDDLGRSVTVPYDPARVVVLGPSIMDIVYRLGLRSHVVGVDCYASLGPSGLANDYSPDQIALWGLSSSMCVESSPTFAAESLVALDPSLVLAATIVSVADVLQITNQLHIPVVMLQPPTLSGILVDDNLVAEIFGVNSAASSLNAQLASALYNATNLTSNAYTLPTVLVTYSADTNGYWTYGPGTFGESLIEICGATSIAANSTTGYPELSPAQVLVDQPQYIVYGTGFGLNESTYAAGPDWSQFSAVQSGNITGIDSNYLTEPDPTMILEGIPALQAVFFGSAA
jgi:iron complex transport system substrate-binding protein